MRSLQSSTPVILPSRRILRLSRQSYSQIFWIKIPWVSHVLSIYRSHNLCQTVSFQLMAIIFSTRQIPPPKSTSLLKISWLCILCLKFTTNFRLMQVYTMSQSILRIRQMNLSNIPMLGNTTMPRKLTFEISWCMIKWWTPLTQLLIR